MGTEGIKVTRGEGFTSGQQSVNHQCFGRATLCVLYPAKVRLIYPFMRRAASGPGGCCCCGNLAGGT